MKKILFAFVLTCCAFTFAKNIDWKTGVWIGEDAEEWHEFDAALSQSLGEFFVGQNAQTVIDFGCGMGEYVKVIQDMGIECDGIDGNPDTPAMTGGLGKVVDFSKPVDLGRTYDWVLSLEVAEHLPPQFETIYIENLIRHSRVGIVLSWANQNGPGHFNMRSVDYVKKRMKEYGYVPDIAAEKHLRKNCDCYWFRYNLMVFRPKK